MAVLDAPPARALPPRSAAPSRLGRRLTGWLGLSALTVVALLMLVPFVVVVLNALKSPSEYATDGALSLPDGFYLQGLVDFWQRVDFGRKLWNSALIAGLVAVLAVLLSALNAYAIGIGQVRGRRWYLVAFLLANTVPQEALVYPLYFLAKQVGLYDNRLSVVIVFTVIQAAFGTYLLSSVYSAFPKEILEAAAMDGASKWQVLWRIVLPVSRPTLAVLLVFFFIWTWNEFFLPLVFLVSNDNQTVPVALGVLQGDRLMDATASSSSALLGILPALLFFLLFQRTLTRGITAGAVK